MSGLFRRPVKLVRSLRPNYLGLLLGVWVYFLSLTPSLLPRSVLQAAIVAGTAFALGYGIGVVASNILRWLRMPEPAQVVKKIIWWVTIPVVLGLAIYFGFKAADWQNGVRQLVGLQPLAGWDLTALFALSFVTANLWRGLARFTSFLAHRIDHALTRLLRLPKMLLTFISLGLAVGVMLLVFNKVVFRGFIYVSDNTYRHANQQTDQSIVPTTSALRSGGPGSYVSWNSLGRQGRNFIGSGPTVQQLGQFNGQPATNPIRVYIGVDAAKTTEQRAQLAVQELERTGAFSRQVLVIMNTTGSGWIEEPAADALEYMYNGNSASVSVQYSFLPSWITQISSQSSSTETGQAIYDAVYAAWSKLPANSRPKLLSYGLSLGSYSGQSPFKDASDMATKIDGAVFAGSPNFSQPWHDITLHRDPSSPEYKPVYQAGSVVKFANTNQDIMADGPTHILYLQHPSDPVVWWSSDLIFHKPDWLAETRGYDVSPSFHWYPFISFLQVGVDQFFATKAPVGHGHNYANSYAYAWAAVAQPEGWSQAQTARLQQLLNSGIYLN